MVDDFVVIGDRGRVQAHRGHARRRREPGRRRPLQERGGRRSTTRASATTTWICGRCSRPRSSRTRPPPRSSSSSGRCSRSTGSGRSPARSRPTGRACRSTRVLTGVPEGPFRDLAKLCVRVGRSELLAGPARRRLGRVRAPGLGEAAEALFSSFAGAIGGAAVAGEVKRRPAWTSSRTSSRGSATSARSSAARARPGSTARSSSSRRTTRRRRRRSARSSG